MITISSTVIAAKKRRSFDENMDLFETILEKGTKGCIKGLCFVVLAYVAAHIVASLI